MKHTDVIMSFVMGLVVASTAYVAYESIYDTGAPTPGVYQRPRDLPRGQGDAWMTVQFLKVNKPYVDVIGCPGEDPLRGPVTFQIASDMLADAAIPGAFAPILYTKNGRDDYEFKGYAALSAGDTPVAGSEPADGPAPR